MCSLYFWLFLTIVVYDLYSLVHYFFWHFYNIGILFAYPKKSTEEKTLFSIKRFLWNNERKVDGAKIKSRSMSNIH